MRQLTQDISSGALSVTEVPAPRRPDGWVLVATRASLISAGTERAVMQLGEASLVGKARARPDLVRKVVESARTEGIATTYSKVRGRLDEPNPLGYSLCGTVLEADPGSSAGPGDLVACAGAGYATHAEVVAVPPHLCARVPDGVEPEDAAYATVAAIALHGFRLTGVTLGEVVAVIGLGLVGQITLDLVAAAGCVPLGLDPDARRAEMARDAGYFATTEAGELATEAQRLTSGRGADGVLVTAASKSAAPLEAGIAAARERAVVSVVGDVSVQANRTQLFAKELRLVVSRSYGPGRYDPDYEEGGHDYPAGYVRWTEGRNLEEVLRLMASGALSPRRLTSHRFPLEDGPDAYALLGSDEPSLGIVLTYPERDDAGSRTVRLEGGGGLLRRRRSSAGTLRIGVVGAGTFARTVLLPQLSKRADIVAVATATGVSARATAERYGARIATTEPEQVLLADDVDAVVIATRHDTHAAYTTAALEAGKHVFVEKPLALVEDELARVEAAAAASEGVLMVGFNRRFAPLMRRLHDELGSRGPLVITCRVNAGRLPRSHWTHDRAVGGGRLVGEACHFVDCAAFLTGHQPRLESAVAVAGGSEPREDLTAATLSFGDGSVAQIVYSAFGDPRLPKERIEVLGEHGAGVLDDFASLALHRGGRTTTEDGNRDKGHRAEIEAFVEACRSGRQPWPVSDMAAVMRATFAMRDAVDRRRPAAA
jgi:predicted dehydrogenase/threonine dehydrogenase-like Zn-dependent dehydrogenase